MWCVEKLLRLLPDSAFHCTQKIICYGCLHKFRIFQYHPLCLEQMNNAVNLVLHWNPDATNKIMTLIRQSHEISMNPFDTRKLENKWNVVAIHNHVSLGHTWTEVESAKKVANSTDLVLFNGRHLELISHCLALWSLFYREIELWLIHEITAAIKFICT